MRIYLPGTLPALRDAARTGRFRPTGTVGFAVTETLRTEYPRADREDLEYLAMHDAALASLRLIEATGAEPVRVVVVIDDQVPTSAPKVDSRDRATVRLTGDVGWDEVISVHLDGGDAAPVVSAAAAAVDAADLGDEAAALVVGDAEDLDLAGYDPAEVRDLLAHLDGT